MNIAQKRDEFITSSSLAPIWTTQISSPDTPKPCECGRATSTHYSFFFHKKLSLRQSIPNSTDSVVWRLVGDRSCLTYPVTLTCTSPEHCGRVDIRWRINDGKKIKYLLIVAWQNKNCHPNPILMNSLVYFVSYTTINLFKIWEKVSLMEGSKCWRWGLVHD